MTTVSVIMPTYNRAMYLQKALESVLAQDWRDYEIIVLDDGSTDNTPMVAAAFGTSIRYIRQTNHGLAATRNIGIRRASGELISFLDDDDLWLPNYLSSVTAQFRADPDVMGAYTGFQLIGDQADQDFPFQSARVVPAHALYGMLLTGGFFPPSSVTVRRACLDEVGLFDEELRSCEDWELWLRISREHKFIGVPQVLIKYRIHAGGMSTNVEVMHQSRLSVVGKQFGPPDGEPFTWPLDKRRAFAFAYRATAFECNLNGQSDGVLRFLKQAILIWPEIFERLDTLYELAYGGQAKGYRNQPALLDIARNAKVMFGQMEALLAEGGPALAARRGKAYGNAYLALSMLSDQAEHWGDARRYLVRAVQSYPALLRSWPVTRRLLKLCAGQKIVRLGKSLVRYR